MQLKPNQIIVEIDDDGNIYTVHEPDRTEPVDRYAMQVLQAVVAYGCGHLPLELNREINEMQFDRKNKSNEETINYIGTRWL